MLQLVNREQDSILIGFDYIWCTTRFYFRIPFIQYDIFCGTENIDFAGNADRESFYTQPCYLQTALENLQETL